MAQQLIDITPVTGDSGQSGGTKINDNFTELYAAVILREVLSNKATNFTTLNNTLYPSVQAVENRIQAALAGLRWKDPVAVATTANITLSGEQTIDGVLTSGSRVLVKNQSSTNTNGIYVSAAGAWARSSDADVAAELEGATVSVQQGTSNANTTWNQISDNITLGSTSIVWSQFGTSVPSASPSTAGIAKLYSVTTLGNNTDGAPDQNSVKTYVDSKITSSITDNDTTHSPSGDAVFEALATKVDETTPTVLTDGATINWDCGNLQNPEAKVTIAGASRTLNMTNVKDGSTGILKIITNTASAITITFDTDFTNKTQNAALPTYTLPAGTAKEYFFTYFADGTLLEWVIGVDGGVQDLYIPASAMWPRTTGACSDLTKSEIATSLVNIQTLDFDQTTQEFAQFTVVLPRRYNNLTVTAVVYWTASGGSGTVDWGISGGAYSNDDALTVALGTAQVASDTLITANDLHITPETSAITLAGTPADADFLAFQISRNVSTDTLTADAKLLGISLRITTDSNNDA